MARAITEKHPAPLAMGHPQQQQQLQPYPFQETLPTEIWRLVLSHVPTLDLFSLYNTSRYLRSLSAPSLVQAMASKSLRLYFYQEYVRRVGVKFVFESFDLERDRVVFRPLVRDNQYRFRTGMTLQCPQLEEVAVKSGGEIDMRRVQCDRGRYFTIKPAERAAPAPATVQDVSQHSQGGGMELEVDGDMEADVDLEADGLETPEITAVTAMTEATTTTTANTVTTPTITTTPAPSQVIQTTSATRKPTADEKSYQGTKNFLDRSCPVQVRKTGVRKTDGARYSFLQTYPWTLEYQVEGEIMGPHVALQGERRSGSDSTSRSCNGKGKTVDYESKDHIGNTGSSSGRAKGGDQLATDSQYQHQLHQRPQDEIKYERMDSNNSNSSRGSGSGSRDISSHDNVYSNATLSHRRANSPEMADKIADKSVHSGSARTNHRQGSAGNNSNSGNGPRFLRTLRFECSMNFLDPKRATRSVLGRWLEGKVYQWSKVLGGKKALGNGQSHAIQWQSTLKQHSQSQPHLRQQQKQQQKQQKQQEKQQKQQEKQKGKEMDNKQKQPLSTSALYRRLHQDQQIRRSDSTESGGSGTTTPPPAPAAAAPPRRRGRVIRVIDILLGPTDSDGSSINHERAHQHSMISPIHSLSSSRSGSSTSLSLSLPHQGDASIAGGRCMNPAIDLNKMGSSSTSATF
ncbi:hypothetical protein BGX30_014130 [Mortierella sp. GBA39]|nr:hypothetical protein BGX30_014130 [Mortierella sp. GBA39]